MTKKKVIRGLFLFAIYIVILLNLIKYISNNAEIMQRISAAPPHFIIFGMVCSILRLILAGLLNVSCARVYDVNMPYPEAVGLSFIASAGNLIFPFQLGTVLKVIYYKKKLALSYAQYISLTSGIIVIKFMISFVQVIACLIISAFKWNVDASYIWILSGIFMAVMICFLLALRYQKFILRILPFKKITQPIMEGFYTLIKNKKAMGLVTGNLVLSALIGAIGFSFIFQMLGYNGGALNSMLYYGFYAASNIIPILPGNIGISEAIVGLMNSILLDSDFDIGVTVVLITRVYYYITAIGGALIAAYPVWKRYNLPDKSMVKTNP